ncbi:protein-L-isoaspartate O-methyltransferase family protein [Microbacterium sp. A93]|uniref:protein-L-isoaspartate O-methyltransferase family protein n=1 Tax=Microbacterium sp. A93 TaxID=3450716 RepID=UPI003F43F725
MVGIRVDPATAIRVREAMAATPRATFLPPAVRHLAGADRPVMIGWDATNSQPSTVARMLELLDVQPGDRVLDVGSGSAWTTAILATLAGPRVSVIGVEIVAELVDYGRERLAEAGVHAEIRHAEIRHAESGVLGLPEEAPFDRILVSAGANSLPDVLVDQLADGGRLVVPVAGVMTVVDMHAGHARHAQDQGLYSFVPLQGS